MVHVLRTILRVILQLMQAICLIVALVTGILLLLAWVSSGDIIRISDDEEMVALVVITAILSIAFSPMLWSSYRKGPAAALPPPGAAPPAAAPPVSAPPQQPAAPGYGAPQYGTAQPPAPADFTVGGHRATGTATPVSPPGTGYGYPPSPPQSGEPDQGAQTWPPRHRYPSRASHRPARKAGLAGRTAEVMISRRDWGCLAPVAAGAFAHRLAKGTRDGGAAGLGA